jgi:hypothetical protein
LHAVRSKGRKFFAATVGLRTKTAVPVYTTHNYQMRLQQRTIFHHTSFFCLASRATSCADIALDTQSHLFYILPIAK